MKKHILCLGDSNTHGYCIDPNDCADGGMRFNEDERWTCLMQKALGEAYLIIEEGLNGRTTAFPDPVRENMDVLSHITALLKSHEPLDLLVIMLGTNDTKARFSTGPAVIAKGLERLTQKAMSVDCWSKNTPNILLIAPPPIGEGIRNTFAFDEMGEGCVEKSQALAARYREVAALLGVHFMDAADCEFNTVDFMHLTAHGHRQLAAKLSNLIPTLL